MGRRDGVYISVVPHPALSLQVPTWRVPPLTVRKTVIPEVRSSRKLWTCCFPGLARGTGHGHVHDHRVFRGRHNDRQTNFVFSPKTMHYANRPPLPGVGGGRLTPRVQGLCTGARPLCTVLPGLETFLARSPFASPQGLAQDRPSVATPSEPVPIICQRAPSIEYKPRPPPPAPLGTLTG
jgi:hypothetical protein